MGAPIKRSKPRTAVPLLILAVASLAGLPACTPSDAGTEWRGTVDTLASGQVVVRNPAEPMWSADEAWRVVEELRIGSVTAEGPDLFGRVRGLEVDALGRIYVLEEQAQELRVFDASGRHVRTIGRKGGGPGEFARAVDLELGPHGHLWVADPSNGRVSVIDTAGILRRELRIPGGFVIIPWPGGFDRAGRYYVPVPRQSDDGFGMALLRYGPDLAAGAGAGRGSDPAGGAEAGTAAAEAATAATGVASVVVDTLEVPEDPVERDRFELRSDRGVMMSTVPFTPTFRWALSPEGRIWAMFTGEYRLLELSPAGDTLRTITRAFEPLPVTDQDVERAIADLAWFTEQGGKVDRSRFPETKPATDSFFFDDQGNLWVFPVTPAGRERTLVDVFDPRGRYLGRVDLPFRLRDVPAPLVRGGTLYGVTESELEVPFVVRARIEKPGGPPPAEGE